MKALSSLMRRAGRAASCILSAPLAAVLLTAAAPAPSALHISDGWFRALPAPIPSAGYFTLHNDGGSPVTLVGADSPACGMLMLHRSMHNGSTERMVMVDKVAVPAHGTIHFAPGGYHLMCTSPTAAMKHGATVPVTLHFTGGAALTGRFVVKNARGK